MSGRRRALMLGAGGMARSWLRRFLPNFADRLEVVALVDINEQALADGGDFLGLDPARRFTDMVTAFATVEADCCIIVIPPAFHRQAALLAVEHGLPILSEKPIADSWAACLDIAAAVRRAGLKMQVVQNYRYNAPMLTLREVLREGELGRINYLMARFAADYREYGSWGVPFRHEIPHALLVEGAIHHFDMLRNLSGADCAAIAGWEWNPPWSSSKGEFNALYAMTMTSGARAVYEGSGVAAGAQNTWHEEYYRVECEAGAATVGRDHIVRVHRFTRGGGLRIDEIPSLQPTWEGHDAIIGQFLDWLDGGPTPPTALDDNLKSAAMLFAAIEASRANHVVAVAAMIADEAAPAGGEGTGPS
jgi:predicted dehydrogenase